MKDKDTKILEEAYNQIILTEADEFLLEKLTDIFGNLGQEIKDYFMCKRDPEFKQEYTALGQKCPDGGTLFAKIKTWVEQNEGDQIAKAIKHIWSMSKDVDEFLANLKAEFLHNYKKYGLG